MSQCGGCEFAPAAPNHTSRLPRCAIVMDEPRNPMVDLLSFQLGGTLATPPPVTSEFGTDCKTKQDYAQSAYRCELDEGTCE